MEFIKSEQDAIDYLSKKQIIERNPHIVGWDKWQLKITGQGYDGTLDIHVIQSLLELQKSIYRFYTYLKYDITDIKRLTQEEKNRFKINILIEKGSTDITVEILEIIKKVLSDMPHQYTFPLFVLAIVSFFGTQSFKYWLEHKTKNNKMQKAQEKDNAYNELLKTLSTDQKENIKNILNIQNEMHENVLKNLKNTKTEIVYQNENISSEQIKEILKTDRIIKSKKNLRLDGVYKILSINYEEETQIEYKLEAVNVSNLKNTQIIVAFYDRDIAESNSISFKSVEDRNFYIQINGVTSDDLVEEALIVSIEEYKPEQK